jgi:DNA sulfur modification protein DndD
LERHITNLESKVEVHEKQRKQLDYSDKMIRTIADFQIQFQAKRTKELEIAIMEMWNLLAQKEGQVERVEIIPERNFEVRLYDANDREKDKTKLSAGEKEIYAISLLWALVQVSGKQMPIVIDTPYGRLDSIHRENLARYYFPKASHQVFLLSQDKEIVEEYYEILKPAIASEFSITYNSNTRKSEVAKGYKFAKN